MGKILSWRQARRKVDLPALLESYGVKVEKSGSHYKCCCPIHGEKTPSLVIYPDGHWYCYGACQSGGDALSIVMAMDGCGRKAALTRISTMIDSPIEGAGGDEVGEFALRETLFTINEIASGYFQESLDKHGKRVLYHDRGITDESIERFFLGYAPPRGLVECFRSAPISRQSLKESGVVIRGKVPFFRNRLMIPYCDMRGRPTGFFGRAITEEDADEAKYINTAGTPIFTKRRELFLLDHARAAIREKGQAILVEGPLDAIMAHQYGIENAVAIGGTAVTIEHAYALRYIPEVVFALDGDKAGIQSAMKSISILTSEGINVKVVVLPSNGNEEKHDPDSFLRQFGKDAFLERVVASKPYFEAYYDFLMSDTDGSRESKLAAGRELVYALSFAQNPFDLASNLDFISRNFGVARETLGLALEKSRGERRHMSRKRELSADDVDSIISGLPFQSRNVSYEEFFARHILHNPGFPSHIARQLEPWMFLDRGMRSIVKAVWSIRDYRPSRDLASVRESVAGMPDMSPAAMAVMENPNIPAGNEEVIEHELALMRKGLEEERLRQIQQKIVDTPDSDPKRQEYLDQLVRALEK